MECLNKDERSYIYFLVLLSKEIRDEGEFASF